LREQGARHPWIAVVLRAMVALVIVAGAVVPQVTGEPSSSAQAAAIAQQAVPVASPEVELASFSVSPTVGEHWWGYTFSFNRDATAYIVNTGGTTLAAYTTAFGEGVVIGAIVAAADIALAHGNCLQVVVTKAGTVTPWRSHC
jgi:hypothetical protein